MKTKQNLVLVFIAAAMMQPFLFKAQTNGFKDATIARPHGHSEQKTGWQAVDLDGKGSNVQNGVEFYNQSAECNSAKVKLLKLVNTNNYPVKVSYQLSAESAQVNVLVPASASIEGACSATDGNLAKLVITPLAAKTDEEKQKNKDFMRSHITVSQIK